MHDPGKSVAALSDEARLAELLRRAAARRVRLYALGQLDRAWLAADDRKDKRDAAALLNQIMETEIELGLG